MKVTVNYLTIFHFKIAILSPKKSLGKISKITTNSLQLCICDESSLKLFARTFRATKMETVLSPHFHSGTRKEWAVVLYPHVQLLMLVNHTFRAEHPPACSSNELQGHYPVFSCHSVYWTESTKPSYTPAFQHLPSSLPVMNLNFTSATHQGLSSLKQ